MIDKYWIQYLDGNINAFSFIYDYYYPKLLKFFHTAVCDYHICEDLIQVTFTNIIESACRFDRAKNFVPWFRTIAWRVLNDHCKHCKCAPKFVPLDESDAVSIDTSIDISIEQLLSGLSDVERNIIIRYYCNGDKITDIASDLRMKKYLVYKKKREAESYLASY